MNIIYLYKDYLKVKAMEKERQRPRDSCLLVYSPNSRHCLSHQALLPSLPQWEGEWQQSLKHLLLPFPGSQQEAALEMDQLGHELVPIQDARAADSSFSC